MIQSDDTLLQRYVSNLDRPVFAITGLPEEVIAVLLAYYSRSRDDLRTNLSRLLTDDSLGIAQDPTTPGPARAMKKARDFHEKWVVGYGHASVAEHAVIHLAVEQVSIVASKVIEDLRLGSYTEKSTRYVVFDTGSFTDLPDLPESLRREYTDTCRALFSTYLEMFGEVEEKLDQLIPTQEGQSGARRAAAIRAHACDLLRGILPAGTKTNLGITANARALAMLLTKMLSWPLPEVQKLATQMRTEAATIAPTLLRHVDPNAFRSNLRRTITEATPACWNLAMPQKVASKPSKHEPVHLLRYDGDALQRIVLALCYDLAVEPASEERWNALLQQEEKTLSEVITRSLANRGPHDPPPRALEASSVTVELDLDYGAYRDLQRHRMLSPSTQLLGCSLGAMLPDDVDLVGIRDRYQSALDSAARVWERIAQADPFAAQYVVPLSYRVRTLWTLNLREVFHVIELRSAKQGHASYRRVAQALYREVCRVHPWLEGLIRVDMQEYRLARS